MSWSQCQGE